MTFMYNRCLCQILGFGWDTYNNFDGGVVASETTHEWGICLVIQQENTALYLWFLPYRNYRLMRWRFPECPLPSVIQWERSGGGQEVPLHHKYTSTVTSASVGCGFGYNLNCCVMTPRNTVLMMSPSLSHYCLEGEDQGGDGKDGKYCVGGPLGYGDMKWQWVMCGRRGEGRTCGMASEVCMDKGTCKSRTAGSPGSAKCKPKKE